MRHRELLQGHDHRALVLLRLLQVRAVMCVGSGGGGGGGGGGGVCVWGGVASPNNFFVLRCCRDVGLANLFPICGMAASRCWSP
jgi:hypothetical protein